MAKKGIKRILILITLLFLNFTNLFSQAGGASVLFISIPPDARASGMGEVGTAIADDINAVFWNPAGLGFKRYVQKGFDPEDVVPYRQISLSFSKWLPQFNADLYYSYGTVGQFFEALDGTVAFNFVFMHLGEFTRTNERGDPLGKFRSNEFAFGLSYGTMVAKDFSIGFQLRFIQSNLAPASALAGGDAGVGRSASFDLGLLWKPTELNAFGLDLGNIFSLGFNLQNVGPKITYRKESDPIPTTLRLGTAINIYKDEYNDLKFAVDMSKLLVYRDTLTSDPVPKSFITGWKNPGVELAFGAEYWYENLLALRAGYFNEPSALGNRKYWNFGAGLRYDIFRLDFSFINTIEENHPLANTMRFSLLIDWK
ncbi:MAG: PorV/PorQ family protein [Ignavibacteria bacterium]|nr:PorV/PorQ family protein [Ignavibacteria bacterium]